MNLKTQFAVFDVVLDDAVFKVKEMDPTRFMINRITGADGKAVIDVGEILDAFSAECIVGWEGITADETKTPLEFSKDNIKLIPALVKAAIWAKFLERCSLNETEKKN